MPPKNKLEISKLQERRSTKLFGFDTASVRFDELLLACLLQRDNKNIQKWRVKQQIKERKNQINKPKSNKSKCLANKRRKIIFRYKMYSPALNQCFRGINSRFNSPIQWVCNRAQSFFNPNRPARAVCTFPFKSNWVRHNLGQEVKRGNARFEGGELPVV